MYDEQLTLLYDDDDDSIVHGPVQVTVTVTVTLMLNAEKMNDLYSI